MNTRAVIDYIVEWLNDYSNNARTCGFVVGISGGVDSAVTSALACKTNRPVLCLEMPIFQDHNQVTRSQDHIEFLQQNYPNVRFENVNLTPLFECMLSALPPVADEQARYLTLANTRSRLRMTVLYYFAGLNNDLVVGTGNKVEDFGVGFFTKYGDGGVDISPIADLFKSEVYELAKALGVNKQIMNAPPTDGLWGDDRTDEDQIGASYPELEWAMQYSGSNQQAKLTPRQKQVLTIYERSHKANQHKVQPIPVCYIPGELKLT